MSECWKKEGGRFCILNTPGGIRLGSILTWQVSPGKELWCRECSNIWFPPQCEMVLSLPKGFNFAVRRPAVYTDRTGASTVPAASTPSSYLQPFMFSPSREHPIFFMFVQLAIISIFKSYPTVGDIALYMAFLPLWSHLYQCKLFCILFFPLLHP